MKKIDNSECLARFGLFIRKERERRELTQEEMARKLGISLNYYSLIERGKRNVDLVMAMKICAVLELDLSDYIRIYI